MSKIDISVIIPIYNAEKYLKKCIDSVINQTFKNFEIICINDGSKDNSLKILNEIAAKDKRIIIIDQENSGVSVARNKGLAIAKGKYIAFLDADDYLELNGLKLAFNEIEKKQSDILVFAANLFVNNEYKSNINSKLINKILCNEDYLNSMMRLNTVVWDKLFKTQFLKDNNIEFPKGLVVSEDGIFCLNAYFSNAKYNFLDKCLYNHNDCVENSATSNNNYAIKEDLKSLKYLHNLNIFKKQTIKNQIAVINKFCGGASFYWRRLENENFRNSFYSDIVNLVSFIKENYSKKDLNMSKDYKKLIKIIKQYNGNFPYNIYCKMKFKKAKLIRFFGIQKLLIN